MEGSEDTVMAIVGGVVLTVQAFGGVLVLTVDSGHELLASSHVHWASLGAHWPSTAFKFDAAVAER